MGTYKTEILRVGGSEGQGMADSNKKNCPPFVACDLIPSSVREKHFHLFHCTQPVENPCFCSVCLP